MKIGEAIRRVRLLKGISQEEVAKECGLSGGHLSLVESGKRNISWKTLRSVSKALGVSVVVLVMLTEVDNPVIAPYMPLIYKGLMEQGLTNKELP
jgi:transcriptional regulator with XRE-family HTH domain